MASMSLINDRVLSPAELRALSGRSNAAGARRAAVHVALLGMTGWLVAIAGPWTVVPAVLALGLVQVALFAPAHEATHQTAFASRRANAVLGWLAACPSLLNLHFYTAFRFSTPRSERPDTIGAYMRRIAGLPYWRLRLLVIADCWRGDVSRYPYLSSQAAPMVIRSVRAMSLLLGGGALTSGMLFGWITPLLFWILPQLLCQPFLRAYVLAEHTGCTMDRNGLTNTRTTLTNAGVRLLMWNMPFHAEHHLYPSIPFHRLADAHAALRDRLAVVEPRGYLRWNLAFLRTVRRRTPASASSTR